MVGDLLDVRRPGGLELFQVQPIATVDVRHQVAEIRGERAGRGAQVGLGRKRTTSLARRFDLLEPLVEEMPADGNPEQDQEQGPEETRIVASRGSQGSAPFRVGSEAFGVLLSHTAGTWGVKSSSVRPRVTIRGAPT